MSTDQADTSDETPRDTAVSRREWVRRVTAGVSPLVGLGALTAVVRAAHDSNTPDHVEPLAYDEDARDLELLERYKPRLLTHDLDVEPSRICGAVARSSSKSTTALTYWTQYPVQLDATGYASHIGDREPFFVFIENEGLSSEQIARVAYSGYHWMIARSRSPPTDTGDMTGQPRAYVFPDYHHYGLDVARSDPRPGEDVTLVDLRPELDRWLDDHAFHDALAADWEDRGSPAFNPWIALDKASYWRKEGLTSFEEWIRSMWLLFGLHDADRTDLS